jgi:hypothetical protein
MAESQSNIFGRLVEQKKSTDRYSPKPKKDTDEVSIMADMSVEKDADKFAKSCLRSKENYSFLKVWVKADGSPFNRNEFFVFEGVTERPFRGDWDNNYGGWSKPVLIGKNNREAAKKEILSFVNERFHIPYLEKNNTDLYRSTWFRDIKDENILIFYSTIASIWLGEEIIKDINLDISKLFGNVATEEQESIAREESAIRKRFSELKRDEYENYMKILNEQIEVLHDKFEKTIWR